MLLDCFGVQKGGVAEFQLGDLECGAYDVKFLRGAFTIRIRDDRVLEGHVTGGGREEFLHGVNGMIDGGAGFRERAIKKGKLAANGIVQSRIREPRNIVEVDGDSRRFVHVISHQDAGELGLKVVTHFSEEPTLNEFVGSGLQIIAADLGAGNQAGYSDDLSLGEVFFSFHVDFAQRGTDSLRSLYRRTESGQHQSKHQSAEARSKIAKHISILTETARATPRKRS